MGLNFHKAWNCELKTFISKRDVEPHGMMLVQNDAWNGVNILIHDIKGTKKIYSSANELNSMLQHLNYLVKN